MEIIDAYWQYSAIHALNRPWRKGNNDPSSREGLNGEMSCIQHTGPYQRQSDLGPLHGERSLVEDPVGPL